MDFRRFWASKSRRRDGRPELDREVRALIRKMSTSNPTWGALRIRNELATIGITVARSTVAKYTVRQRKPPSPTWRSFLDNHVKDLVSLDFFVVPTATFRVLFVLLILAHDRRRILHFNVTSSPSAEWTCTAGRASFSCRQRSTLLATRSRLYLWEILPSSRQEPGDRRGAHCCTFPLAKSIRRTADRFHPARMLEPCHRAE